MGKAMHGRCDYRVVAWTIWACLGLSDGNFVRYPSLSPMFLVPVKLERVVSRLQIREGRSVRFRPFPALPIQHCIARNGPYRLDEDTDRLCRVQLSDEDKRQ